MTGLPDAIQVLLDDGTGTYPTDLSSRLNLSPALAITGYGRTDEEPSASPATLTLQLDNIDGALSTGAGTLAADQGIRVKLTKGATTRNRFTGKISALGLTWPAGGEEYARLAITAVDPLAEAARIKLRSMLEQEILLLGPSAYYTCGEPQGSTSAGDTSGNQAQPLTSAGTGKAFVFGTGTGPGVDGLTAVTFAGGKHLQGVNAGGFIGTGAFSVELFVAVTATPAGPIQMLVVDDDTFALGTSPNGVSWFVLPSGLTQAFIQWANGLSAVVTSATNIVDGLLHHLVFTFDGVSTLTLYVDGVAEATSSSATPLPSSKNRLSFGGYSNAAAASTNNVITGTIAHVALHDGVALTSTQVATINDTATGYSETTDDRFARLLSYTNLTGTTTAGLSGQMVGVQATSGKSVADALQEVATAEGGFLYANGDGDLVLQGRSYRASKTTANLALPAPDVPPDAAPTIDTQQKVDQVTVSRLGGATQIVGSTGQYPQTLDLVDDNDADALRAAQWIIAKRATPGSRFGALQFDLLSSPNAEAMLGLEVGDRVDFASLPAQVWADADQVTVEGWTETIAQTAADATWTVTANVLPFTLFDALVLDDPVYGALDSYPIMN